MCALMGWLGLGVRWCSVRGAVRRLRARPELLGCVLPHIPPRCMLLLTGEMDAGCRECPTTLAHTRRAALHAAFLAALTGSSTSSSSSAAGGATGGGGGVRPIERHAHDPLRYVGDMLA